MTQQAQPVKPLVQARLAMGVYRHIGHYAGGQLRTGLGSRFTTRTARCVTTGMRTAVHQSELARRYATALSIRADLSFRERTVKVNVAARYAIPTESLPASWPRRFPTPTDSGKDVSLSLARQADGSYTGTLPKALAGRYYVELGCKNWRLRTENIFPREALELSAEPPRS